MGQDSDFGSGKYEYNNLVINNTFKYDNTISSYFEKENLFLKCEGNFYLGVNGELDKTSTGINNRDGSDGTRSAYYADGPTNKTWSGGGGGTGGLSNTGGTGTSISQGSGSSAFSTYLGVAGVGASGGFVLLIEAENIEIRGALTNTPDSDGTSGTNASGGGGGGCGGDSYLYARNDLNITSSGSIENDGSNGGDGTSFTGTFGTIYSGGGGGADGGLIVIRSTSYTNNGSISYALGTGGASGGGSATAGTDGTIGSIDQVLLATVDLSTIINDNSMIDSFYLYKE